VGFTVVPRVEILLVEDSPADVGLVREALLELGAEHQLHVVQDGDDALAFVQGQGKYMSSPRPDLVLLDINLPGKSGFDVLQEIKEHPEFRLLPVVILSSSRAKKDVEKAYRLCANGYVAKPRELDDFYRVIRNIYIFWMTTAELPQAYAARR